MASAAVQSFHDANMADERRRVALRIANGTKASSPNVICNRRQHPEYKGMPDTSTGSRTSLFFQTTNQRDLPFQQMISGGVIKNFDLAKGLLKQRAESSKVIDDIRQGLPPEASPLLQLSEVDSRSLELNALLSGLQDAVEIGNLTAIWSSELKNILRLFSSLLPTFTGDQLADFLTFFDSIYAQLATDKAARRISESERGVEKAVFEFSDKMYNLIEEYAPFVGRSLEERKKRIEILLKKFFKLTPKQMKLRFLAPSEVPSYPFQPPPPASERLIAPAQTEEVEAEAEGESAAQNVAEGGPVSAPKMTNPKGQVLWDPELIVASSPALKKQIWEGWTKIITSLVASLPVKKLREFLTDTEEGLFMVEGADKDVSDVAKMKKKELQELLLDHWDDVIPVRFSKASVNDWTPDEWEEARDALFTTIIPAIKSVL
jgi:hypothetical protein